jgi:hypothetical protein
MPTPVPANNPTYPGSVFPNAVDQITNYPFSEIPDAIMAMQAQILGLGPPSAPTTMSGPLLFSPDNTYDIGANGANRPANIYAGTQFRAVNGSAGLPGYSFASNTNSGILWASGLPGVVMSSNSANIAAFSNSSGVGVRINGLVPLGWSSGEPVSTATDLFLARDAANTLAQRNSTNPQTLRVYNTFTDAANYARLTLSAGGTTTIYQEQAGTGPISHMYIGTTGAGAALQFNTAATGRWQIQSTGVLIAVADNTYDIGAYEANRPRDVILARQLRVGTVSGGGSIAFQHSSGGSAQGTALTYNVTNGTLTIGGGNVGILQFTQGATFVWWMDSAATGALKANVDNVTDIGASGVNRPRNIFSAGAVQTGGKAGVALDADVTNPTDGMLRYDSTNNRLYVRVGAVWRYAALT